MNLKNLHFKHFYIYLNLWTFCSNSRGMCLSNCLTAETCLLHFAIVFCCTSLLLSTLVSSTFPLWTKWKIFGVFCTQMSHRARSQVSCKATVYPSRHLRFLPVFPHCASPWQNSKLVFSAISHSSSSLSFPGCHWFVTTIILLISI